MSKTLDNVSLATINAFGSEARSIEAKKNRVRTLAITMEASTGGIDNERERKRKGAKRVGRQARARMLIVARRGAPVLITGGVLRYSTVN